MNMNRAIRARDLDTIFVTGPGHGGPGLVANTYLEGTYSEVYPDIGLDEDGMRRLFRQFSFPGGIPSHVAPETPGSIHEGVLIKKTHHGALVCVLDALSVFVPRSHLRRRDGSDSVVLGLRLPFKVLEFSGTEEHLLLSHTATFDGDKQEAKQDSEEVPC